MFTIQAKEGSARTGSLRTKTCAVPTPAFMPVLTKGAAKFLTIADLELMGVDVFISNAFLLYLKPGLKAVGDIHEFLSWKKAIFTDCGAFQMLRTAFYRGYTKQGIHLRNPFSGSVMLLTPRDIMKIQLSLRCDVAMALDFLPDHKVLSETEIQNAVNLTIAWHTISKQVHDKIQAGYAKDARQLLFGIGQGGLNEDLRRSCLKSLVQLDFDGYALGGLCIGEGKKEMFSMVQASKDVIPEEKPVYLMGVGSPEDIVLAILAGIDIFDSAYPTQLARHNQIFTWDGYLNLKLSSYAFDDRPLCPLCDCWVCRRHSRKYIFHISKVAEPAAHILKSYHNLYFLQSLMRRCRQEIQKGTFTSFARKFCESYSLQKDKTFAGTTRR